ncbi:DNA polymerase-3 subunit epsilon [Streptacidiphilus sp. MAP12-16]|jgi:DNA polymerase III subunit epsilon|uniref:exonuclease domain-containing protein n=1 Tax=Streptacidiphilus sp. MAP12-16 TaxID=3156300 RepID=UPI0035112987
MSWLHDTLVGFDLETTGTDPAESRIVTAALVEAKGGVVVRQRDWLADPGVAIPADAAAIHGIGTERAVAEGRPVAEVADEVAAALCEYWRSGVQAVVFNAAFDLSLLSAELRRHGLPSLEHRLGGGPIGPVLDPLTVDRAVDKYRKGSRTLQSTCAVYGVELADAHQAGSDALAALRVALALGRKYPAEVGGLAPVELHHRQIGWHAAWAEGLQAWLRTSKEPQAVVDGSWPLRVATAVG